MEVSGLVILPVNRLGSRLDSQKPGQEAWKACSTPACSHPNAALSDWTTEKRIFFRQSPIRKLCFDSAHLRN